MKEGDEVRGESLEERRPKGSELLYHQPKRGIPKCSG